MASLGPDIGNHNGFAVATDGVTQKVGQFGLTVRDVATLLARQCKYHLFQETERLVDKA